MTHIKALIAMVCRLLLHIVIWLEYKLLGIATFFKTASDIVHEIEDDITPTWRETVWPLCAAIIGTLAVYFLLTVGGD